MDHPVSLPPKHIVIIDLYCIYRELVFGEHDLLKQVDCNRRNQCAPPVQRRRPVEIIQHPGWNENRFTEGDDIALIRLDRPVSLFTVS